MVWNWYAWPSLAAFDTWHALAMADQHIPHPGRNTSTGEVDPDAQWTTAYTEPTIVAVDDVRARVEWFIAEKLPDGMGALSEAPPSPDVPLGGF
jgi:hypothetical protein